MDAAKPKLPKKTRSQRPNPVAQWLVSIVLRASICLVQGLSIETCQSIARLLAVLCYDVLRIRRSVVDKNLEAAFAELPDQQRSQLARQMWQHILLMVCELAHVPRKVHDTNWRSYVTLSRSDIQKFVRLLLSERPTIFVSGHFGNFEVGGIIAGLLGFPTFTVARPLDNPYLHRVITRFREGTGQYMLPKQGSAGQIDKVLKAGATIVLLGDQAAGRKGCWVEFFGRPASCHKAVALFSLVNEAPMCLAYSKRLDRPMHFQVGITDVHDPTIDEIGGVKELTQWYCNGLEQTIRSDPSQYWWLHRRWKGNPNRRRRRKNQRRRDAGGRAGPPAPHAQKVAKSGQHGTQPPRPPQRRA